MHFSRSIIAAALVGLGAATSHEQMGNGYGAAVTTTAIAAAATSMAHEGAASKATSAVHEGMASTALQAAVSETLATSAAGMAAHETKASAPAAQAPAASGAAAPAEGQVNTHVVQVGAGGLTFSPSNVIAQPGDLVQFQFNPKNHSVVQSTFDNPCIPIQNILANKTDAFFSGFMPTAVNSTAKPLTYTIRVMDTKPVWFYCSQAKHCQSGMVGAINAATSGNKTVAAFAGLAAVAVENLSPGQAPGQAAASGAPGAAASSGAAPAGEGAATGTGGLVASTSSPSNPAQQTTNAAPGRLSDVGRQSFLGLGLGGLAAFIVL